MTKSQAKQMHFNKSRTHVDGYLTVYMALSLAVIFSLVAVLIEGVRQNSARTNAEIALDTSMQSLLAEYNKELWEKYDLLFVDMSYGTEWAAKENIEEHLKQYMDSNLPHTSLLQMNTQASDVLSISIATDNDGEVFRKQIIQYMQLVTGQKDIEKWLRIYKENKSDELVSSDFTKEQKDNQNKIDTYPVPKRVETEKYYDVKTKETKERKKEIEVPIENPADGINYKRSASVLDLVMERKDQVSNASVDLDEYISHREDVIRGNTTMTEVNSFYENDFLSEILFQMYIFEKFGCYGAEKDNTGLKYQIEYILAGKNSDRENLENVVTKLLVMREAANLLFLKSNSTKMEEIETMALGVAAVGVSPELYPLIKESITFGWAFLESVQDVKALLENKKVPLLKSNMTWQTDLSAIIEPNKIGQVQEDKKGFEYREYLTLLMSIENKTKKNLRVMDLVEMNIRQTRYNENFRLDGCAESIQACVNLLVKGGKNCEVTRQYSYSK